MIIVHNITPDDIESALTNKELKRGGFDKRIYLESVETND